MQPTQETIDFLLKHIDTLTKLVGVQEQIIESLKADEKKHKDLIALSRDIPKSEIVQDEFLKAETLPTTPEEYEAAQAEWVKKHNIKNGSKVKILRTFKDKEGGCTPYFNSQKMQKLVNKAGKVIGINNGEYRSVVVKVERGSVYAWPYFCLEPVEE